MHRLLIAVALLPSLAQASEVVWFGPSAPSQERAARVAADAEGPLLHAADLWTAASAFGSADQERIDALLSALEEVRPYETRLDGELVIMRDLQRPIEALTVLRDGTDRDLLYKALTYQGFAVDRFFMSALDSDEQAEPFRVSPEGQALERPWVDAVAIEPERSVSAYEIAEAPQRVAYGELRSDVLRLLPATLVPLDLPSGARFVLDGREVTLGGTGSAQVPMGRHLAHAVVDGQIIQRWDLRVEPGQEVELRLDLPSTVAEDWARRVWAGEDALPPSGLRPHLEALGGEVWLAREGRRGIDIVKVSATSIERTTLAGGDEASDDSPLSVSAGLSGGWLSHGNFALDLPGAEFSRKEVNALALGLSLGAAYTRGSLRLGAGIETLYTPGAAHVQRYADTQTHFRVYPYLAAGLPWLQLTLGYALPLHPTAGLRLELPVAGGLEVYGTAWYGLGTTRSSAPEDYVSKPLFQASIGVAWRVGVGK